MMYHNICTAPSNKIGPWKYTVSPSLFEEQIEFLSEKYKIVTLDELVEKQESERNLAVITFDDGYRNNLTKALPILEKYEAPGTVYVSTEFIDGKAPYEFLLAGTVLQRDSIDVTVSGKRINRTFNTQTSRAEAFREIKQVAKRSRNSRQELLEKLSVEDAGVSMLSAEEIRELDEHPLATVGAHGHRHLPLASLSDSEIVQEVEKCTLVLEDILGHPVSHFSYPYGSNNAKVRQVVRDAGYKTAVATNPSYIKLQKIVEKKFSLPRFDGSFTGIK